MAAGQVDEVRLPDRLDRRRVVPLLGRAHEDGLDLRAQRSEVVDAHVGPAPERRFAVEGRRGRQDDHAGPRPTGRLEEASVELGHRGKELSGAHERHRSGHARSIEQGPESGRAGPPDWTPRSARLHTRRTMHSSQRWTMVAVILGSSMVFLDGTVMNLALPKIGKELPGTLVSTLEGQTYAVSGYLAVLAALLILGGALADYHGRRKVFSIGLAGFGLTSIMCGLAPTLELLVVARLLQGAAGALLVPGSLAILTALFEGPARARAFGIWASATSATALLGPVIGGLLVDGVSWRAAFLINVPLVIVALYATRRHMAETKAEDATGTFDWLGAFVAVVAVGGLAFGAIRGQDRNWEDPVAWAALIIGTIALIAFPILMARRPNPLVPLGLFRRRAFATINLSTLLIYGAMYTIFYIQGLFLQGVIGYSATAAGVIGLPTGILLTVLSTRVGTLAGRYGPRRFLVAGPLLMAAGLTWLSRVPA